jgi:hypothetical protein
VSASPEGSGDQRPATRRALGARARTPMAWIAIPAVIAIVLAIGFALRAIL